MCVIVIVTAEHFVEINQKFSAHIQQFEEEKNGNGIFDHCVVSKRSATTTTMTATTKNVNIFQGYS